MQDFQTKYFNKQQSTAVCRVYSHSLYIAAYPRAEVLLLIPAWLLLINGKRCSSQQRLTADSKGGKVVHYGLTQWVLKRSKRQKTEYQQSLIWLRHLFFSYSLFLQSMFS